MSRYETDLVVFTTWCVYDLDTEREPEVECELELMVRFNWAPEDREVGAAAGPEDMVVYVLTDGDRHSDDSYVRIPALDELWQTNGFWNHIIDKMQHAADERADDRRW